MPPRSHQAIDFVLTASNLASPELKSASRDYAELARMVEKTAKVIGKSRLSNGFDMMADSASNLSREANGLSKSLNSSNRGSSVSTQGTRGESTKPLAVKFLHTELKDIGSVLEDSMKTAFEGFSKDLKKKGPVTPGRSEDALPKSPLEDSPVDPPALAGLEKFNSALDESVDALDDIQPAIAKTMSSLSTMGSQLKRIYKEFLVGAVIAVILKTASAAEDRVNDLAKSVSNLDKSVERGLLRTLQQTQAALGISGEKATELASAALKLEPTLARNSDALKITMRNTYMLAESQGVAIESAAGLLHALENIAGVPKNKLLAIAGALGEISDNTSLSAEEVAALTPELAKLARGFTESFTEEGKGITNKFILEATAMHGILKDYGVDATELVSTFVKASSRMADESTQALLAFVATRSELYNKSDLHNLAKAGEEVELLTATVDALRSAMDQRMAQGNATYREALEFASQMSGMDVETIAGLVSVPNDAVIKLKNLQTSTEKVLSTSEKISKEFKNSRDTTSTLTSQLKESLWSTLETVGLPMLKALNVALETLVPIVSNIVEKFQSLPKSVHAITAAIVGGAGLLAGVFAIKRVLSSPAMSFFFGKKGVGKNALVDTASGLCKTSSCANKAATNLGKMVKPTNALGKGMGVLKKALGAGKTGIAGILAQLSSITFGSAMFMAGAGVIGGVVAKKIIDLTADLIEEHAAAAASLANERSTTKLQDLQISRKGLTKDPEYKRILKEVQSENIMVDNLTLNEIKAAAQSAGIDLISEFRSLAAGRTIFTEEGLAFSKELREDKRRAAEQQKALSRFNRSGRSIESGPLPSMTDPHAGHDHGVGYRGVDRGNRRGVTPEMAAGVDLLKELYPEMNVTSMFRSGSSGIGRAGRKSQHGLGNAADITMPGLEDPEVRKLVIADLNKRGFSVLDEYDPAIRAKTGATGPHLHVQMTPAGLKPKSQGGMANFATASGSDGPVVQLAKAQLDATRENTEALRKIGEGQEKQTNVIKEASNNPPDPLAGTPLPGTQGSFA